MKPLLAAAAALALAGCASIANDDGHELRIETATAGGQRIEGVDCEARNEHGAVRLRSGAAARIRRSATDLQIACNHPGQPPAEAIARSRANAGMVGNFLLAGGILGAAIDHGRGAGYSYPSWIEMRFGQKLVFDQARQEQGKVLAGYPPGAEPPLPGASRANTNDCQNQLPGAVCR